jgi:hypothetical protein
MPKGHPGTKAPHGTYSRYLYWDCRCAKCRRFVRERRRERVGSLPLEEYLAKIEPAHGTESRYNGYSCRCDLCREASARARRERRAKTA